MDRRLLVKKSASKTDIDVQALNSKIDLLTRQLEKAHFASSSSPVQQAMACDTCGGNDHTSSYFVSNMETAAMMGVMHDPYSSTYNPGWKDHPNMGWRNNQVGGGFQNNYQRPRPAQTQASSFRPPGFNQEGPNQPRPPFPP